jgi:predicted RNase H-like nuclease (RuvC/YqgF family)
MNSATPELENALSRLDAALQKVETGSEVVERLHIENKTLRDEVGHLKNECLRLAQRLEEAEKKAHKLSEANQTVSRRLVNAMESIRRVLDGQKAPSAQ